VGLHWAERDWIQPLCSSQSSWGKEGEDAKRTQAAIWQILVGPGRKGKIQSAVRVQDTRAASAKVSLRKGGSKHEDNDSRPKRREASVDPGEG
jgi:hypothetical protein